MKILIAHQAKIPVTTYGGTERIIWWLGKELVRLGHQVTYLVKQGSTCSFANILIINSEKILNDQIPKEMDLIHCFFQPKELADKPYLVTNQGNVPDHDKLKPLDHNTVFVSQNHAQRHQAECFVYNGIDIEDYGNPELTVKRNYFHFLAKASWKAKNLNGAINITRSTNQTIHVIGGNRLSSKIKLAYRSDPRIKFHGMIGGSQKNLILNHSKGLIFPVVWNEPFGIAMIESLYFGCPVFGTPYGSLPEIINEAVGFLSNSYRELSDSLIGSNYSVNDCHNHVLQKFTTKIMVNNYLELYEKVLSGEKLNQVQPSAGNTFNEDIDCQIAQ